MTAHGITRPGLCKVSGAHLSEAPNAATFAEIDAECQADARAIVRGWDERNDKRAQALDLRQRDVQDVIDRGNV